MEIMRTIVALFVVYLKIVCSGVLKKECCRRVSNVRTVGLGLLGQNIQLDVGRCSDLCEENPPIRSTYVSVLNRIRNAKKEHEDNLRCNGTRKKWRSTCEPSLTHVETIAFNNWPKFYDVIDECSCQKSRRRCEKVPKIKKFFVGTKYEFTIDVGACAGGCRGGKGRKSCRVTRSLPQVVMGPNGPMSLQTVGECRCVASCYRQKFNIVITESETKPDGSRNHKTKIVDVGRCAGSCRPLEQCVAWSKENTKCLMSLETSDVKCVPVRLRDIIYMDAYGVERRATQIRRCGCT